MKNIINPEWKLLKWLANAGVALAILAISINASNLGRVTRGDADISAFAIAVLSIAVFRRIFRITSEIIISKYNYKYALLRCYLFSIAKFFIITLVLSFGFTILNSKSLEGTQLAVIIANTIAGIVFSFGVYSSAKKTYIKAPETPFRSKNISWSVFFIISVLYTLFIIFFR
jgi:hypothetical protein